MSSYPERVPAHDDFAPQRLGEPFTHAEGEPETDDGPACALSCDACGERRTYRRETLRGALLAAKNGRNAHIRDCEEGCEKADVPIEVVTDA